MAGAALVGGMAGCSPSDTAKEASAEIAEEKAGSLSPNWLGSAPLVDESTVAETIDCEVLVVGAGCAGIFAAGASAEEGAKTVLIEKNPEMGNGVRSSALGAVDTSLSKALGVEIDKRAMLNDYNHYALSHSNTDLIKMWLDNSGEAIDWYTEIVEATGEVEVFLEYNMPPSEGEYKYWPIGHGTSSLIDPQNAKENREGPSYRALIDYFLSKGGEIRVGTPLASLIVENGKVVGAYATNQDGGTIRINASKGVILATGGYGQNFEMLDALQPDILRGIGKSIAHPSCTGDGIKSAIWAGAKLEEETTSMLFDRTFLPIDALPGDPNGVDSQMWTFSSQPWLKTDCYGNRVMNESAPYDFICHAVAQRGNRCWYPIWDSSWAEDVSRFHTIGCSTLEIREGGNLIDPVGLDVVASQMEDLVSGGYIQKANTIEELAEKLELDADVLDSTVARYNELFQNQVDEDFGKEPYRLSGIDEPPYYGAKCCARLLATMHGICVTKDLQAIDENNTPIEGLYLAGNDAGNFYRGTYPNFGAGTNAGRAATQGRVLGKYLAAK